MDRRSTNMILISFVCVGLLCVFNDRLHDYVRMDGWYDSSVQGTLRRCWEGQQLGSFSCQSSQHMFTRRQQLLYASTVSSDESWCRQGSCKRPLAWHWSPKLAQSTFAKEKQNRLVVDISSIFCPTTSIVSWHRRSALTWLTQLATILSSSQPSLQTIIMFCTRPKPLHRALLTIRRDFRTREI